MTLSGHTQSTCHPVSQQLREGESRRLETFLVCAAQPAESQAGLSYLKRKRQIGVRNERLNILYISVRRTKPAIQLQMSSLFKYVHTLSANM